MRALILALALMAAPAPSFAFDSSEAVTGDAFTVEQAAAFSKRIEKDLAAQNATLAFVFRSGRTRDKLPAGMAFTHGAVWAHQEIMLGEGERIHGYGVHNLYSGDGTAWPKTESRLIQDWPLDFVRGAAERDVAILIPSPEMQVRLRAILFSDDYQKLHRGNAYALLSNPANAQFQNCTEFMLDLVAASMWRTTDYAQIKANLSAHFEPTPIAANGLQRMFGPLADPRLRTSDHNGSIRTATYESIEKFMTRHGLVQRAYVLKAD
jgi:hypothetical protein